MDLKHDKLAFERSEKQRQQQIRGRMREIDTQVRTFCSPGSIAFENKHSKMPLPDDLKDV